MPDTTRGRSQGLTASLSGRNFRSCLQATKTCCFSLFRGRSGRGERTDPCTYGTFFKVSRRECLPAKKNGAPIPFRRDTWIEGWEVRTGNVKQWMVRDERVRVCEQVRKGKRGGTKSSLSDIEPSSCCAVGHAPNYSSSIDGLKSHWPLVFTLSCYSISFRRTNTLPHLHTCIKSLLPPH